ncbi:VOC family protein [Streptomyces sp. NPDC021020]|uniref:VOC family protein n=1 Tax=Streptomyces sp. NPDC021020 TaxID=3365109 RepID=UPI0037B4DF91
MTPQLRMTAITLDCPDPLALMAFYEAATGLPRHPKSDADFAGLAGTDGALLLGFQRVPDYRPPRWPGQDSPQQLHICFTTDADLPTTESHLLTLGATLPTHQPHGAKARVLTDPAGHPFCIVSA